MTARKRCLVVGGGGREHAIALALARSHAFETVYVAPGNAGTALEPGICNLPVTNIETLALFARRENLAFTVVGPEAPLAKSIVDAFRKQGLPIFGPTQAAAQLEASKNFVNLCQDILPVPCTANSHPVCIINPNRHLSVTPKQSTFWPKDHIMEPTQSKPRCHPKWTTV